MEKSEYQVQIFCGNDSWQKAHGTITTNSLIYAKEQLQCKRRRAPQFTFRIAIRTVGDWCEALEVVK